jgi:hypothetical protein
METSSEIITLVKIIEHRQRVANLLRKLARDLEDRADRHDLSKFDLEEFGGFCQLDNARKYEYGSPEYEAIVHNNNAARLHVSRNSHHPEYWPDGILSMPLGDILEMLCDWEVARQQRDTETDIDKTWKTRQDRFGLSDYETRFLRQIWEAWEV